MDCHRKMVIPADRPRKKRPASLTKTSGLAEVLLCITTATKAKIGITLLYQLY